MVREIDEKERKKKIMMWYNLKIVCGHHSMVGRPDGVFINGVVGNLKSNIRDDCFYTYKTINFNTQEKNFLVHRVNG